MKDRTPTEVLANGAIRYGVYNADGTLNRYEYIKPEDAPTQEGTPLNKANLLSDEVAALYGLGAEAVPSEAYQEIAKRLHNSLLRDLNIMMNLSLGTSNIDAWADLLVDASRINAGLSSGYYLANGQLTSPERPIQVNDDGYGFWLGRDSAVKIGQEFTATVSGEISKISIAISKVGKPTDALKMTIYAADRITQVATSSTLIAGATLTSIKEKYDFLFLDLQVSEGKKYLIEISRTGAQSQSDYYQAYRTNGARYPQNSAFTSEGRSWALFSSGDFNFSLAIIPTAVVVWNPVTASEALSHATVVADLTLGTGWVKFYLSQDGVTWIEVLALNTAIPVIFTTTKLYLKCVMFGDSVVRAVAWGGY